MPHESFIARLGLTTPLIMSAPTTLDAILLGELAIHLGDDRALAALPLAATDGVFHASRAFHDAINWRIDIPKINSRGNEPRTAPIDRLRGNAKGGRIVASHNHQKNTMNRYVARAVRALYFAGVGDVEEVAGILADVHAVGVRRADGMGLVAEVTVERVDEDPATWGLIDGDGEPMRPVPWDLWRTLGGVPDPMIQVVRARLFYWSPSNPAVPCAVPSDDSAERLLRSAARRDAA